MKHKVGISGRQDFEKILGAMAGIERFVKGTDRVFIKPNICTPKSYQTGTTTNPYLIERFIRSLTDTANNIQIGDGSIPAFGRLSFASYPTIYNIAKNIILM